MATRTRSTKVSEKTKKKKRFSFGMRALPSSVGKGLLLILLSCSIALLLSYRPFTRTKTYRLGEVAESNIKAPGDFLAKDSESTRLKRQEAAESVPPVFDYNPHLYRQTAARLHAVFRSLRGEISVGTGNPDPQQAEEALKQRLAEWNHILGMDLPLRSFRVIERARFSEDIENLILHLMEPVMRQGVMATKQLLYSNPQRGIVVRQVDTGKETRISDPDRFLSLSEAREAIRARASDFMRDFKYPSLMACIRVAQELLTPNLVLNKEEWERRKRQAAAAVKSVYYQVMKNEMIVREGDKLTQRQVDELAALAELQRKEHHWIRVLGMALILSILFYVVSETTNQVQRRRPLSGKDFCFLGTVLFVCFLLVLPAGYLGVLDSDIFVFPISSTLYSTPLTVGPMMVSVFFGAPLALIFSVVVAFIAAVVLQNSIYFFFYFLLGGFIAAISLQECKNRGVLLKTGFLVGLANVFMVVSINMVNNRLFHQATPFDVSFALLGGLMAGIIVTGLIPLGEMVFGYTTNIKLLELANLDSPILKELMIVAPGTYHHSLIVGSLVEAAAKAIGANSLLCKVAAYYHDLGKIRKPDYFIENQGAKNRHEKLAPSMSSLILISHVKEGVDLARQHRLGDGIIDIIQQHHGTSLISYFYQKAKEMKGQDQSQLTEAAFRYPGPKPQTREAGLVLLADVTEAASRTLQNPTPSRVQGMVQKIINKVFSDGQLDECELTLKDLHEVAKHFNQILNGIFHQRIQYPEPVEKSAASAKKNGSSSKQSAKPAADRPAEPEGEDQENLRRLGL